MTRKDTSVVDALNVIGRALRGRVEHGTTIKGTLDVGELEVEITLVATRKVPRPDTERYQKEALALLERDGFHDHCWTTVKNRSAWSVTKTKTCESRVTTAMVYRKFDTVDGKVVQCEGYRFCCSHHTEHSRDVIATVRLPQVQLDRIRETREKENAIRRREEEAKENKERVEKALGRPLADSDMVKVKLPSDLSLAQEAIVRELLAKRYHDAHMYVRMVVFGQGPRELDFYLDAISKQSKADRALR